MENSHQQKHAFYTYKYNCQLKSLNRLSIGIRYIVNFTCILYFLLNIFSIHPLKTLFFVLSSIGTWNFLIFVFILNT